MAKGDPGQKLAFPYLGVSDQNTFTSPPPFTVPPDALQNVRPRGKTRGRGTTRPPLAVMLDRQIGSGQPGQKLATVSRAALTTGFTVGDRFSNGNPWEGRVSDLLQGQLWMLGGAIAPQMFRDYYLDVTAVDDAGLNRAAVACCWVSPALYRAVFCVNYLRTPGAYPSCRVRCVDQQGVVLWTKDLHRAGTDPVDEAISANTVHADTKYAYIATTNGLCVLRINDGDIRAKQTLGGWASEVIEARVRPDGRIAVLFVGAGFSGTLPNLGGGTAIAPGATAFRSGVMLFERNDTDTIPLLTQRVFSDSLDPAAPLWEANHRYLRFAEKSIQAPYGTWPSALGTGATDNSIAAASSNKGWGPNASYPPPDVGPYVSVRKIDVDGNLVWEVDPATLRRAYSGSWGIYHNDYPQAGHTDPTLIACCMDPDGNVYVAGERNAAGATSGFTVAKLGSADGSLLAVYNTSGTARSIAWDPTDGTVVVAGDRNANWTGHTGNAHLWKLANMDLSLVWSYDINEAVSGLSVDVNAAGQIVYSTDYVS